MNLQEFVSETLKQIIQGVVDAEVTFKAKRGKINPVIVGGVENVVKLGMGHSFNDESVQIIEFDVALTVNEEKGTKGGIGVFVGAIGLGSQGESRQESASLSRVRFKVPISLPRPE